MKAWGWALMAACLISARPACADVKIVTEVTWENQTAGTSAHQTMTIFYRGDQARVETEKGGIMLYDLRTRSVYRLDTVHMTYSVVGIGQLPPPTDKTAQLAEKLLDDPKLDLQIKLKTAADKRVVAGADANKVELTASAEADSETVSGAGGSAAGRGAGPGPNLGSGGFGAGIPVGAGSSGGVGTWQPSSIDVQGELWLSPTLSVTDAAVSRTLALLPLLAVALPENRMAVRLLEPLATRLDQQTKGIPLASHLTVKLARGGHYDSDSDEHTVVVTTETKSITEGHLDRTLFFVPAEYRQSYPIPLN